MHKLYSNNLSSAEKRKLKAELVEEFENSSLKTGEFCKLNGIKSADFYNWRTRQPKSNGKTTNNHDKFIPMVGMAEPWVLKLQGYHELQIPQDFDPIQLKKLLQVIGNSLC